MIHKHHTHIFDEVVPQILPLLEKHGRLGHAGIINHCQILIYRCHIKEEKGKKKKEKKEKIFKIYNYKCIMANTSAIWEQATHTTHTKSAPSCS